MLGDRMNPPERYHLPLANQILDALLDMTAEASRPITIAPFCRLGYAGTYVSESDGVAFVTATAEGLQVDLGEGPTPLQPTSETVFLAGACSVGLGAMESQAHRQRRSW
jgi:hypothetical protein